eukprot:3554783-Rhodomonas_salina.1
MSDPPVPLPAISMILTSALSTPTCSASTVMKLSCCEPPNAATVSPTMPITATTARSATDPVMARAWYSAGPSVTLTASSKTTETSKPAAANSAARLPSSTAHVSRAATCDALAFKTAVLTTTFNSTPPVSATDVRLTCCGGSSTTSEQTASNISCLAAFKSFILKPDMPNADISKGRASQ